MRNFASRNAATTISCPFCDSKMNIERSCTEVHMRCPSCKKDFPLKDFIGIADKAMDNFLENVYLDRI